MFIWEGITEFVAVAKTQSFTQASKQLGISTAQVSRQISALEKRLAVTLFNRTTRKVSTTELGEIYYQECKTILDSLSAAEMNITQFQSVPAGLLRITAPINYGEKIIAPLITNFSIKYPDLNIELFLTNDMLNLVEDGFDLAIRLGNLESSTLMAKRLATRRLVVCAAPSYLAEFGTPTSIEELSNHNCLKNNKDFFSLVQNGKIQNVKVNGNLRFNSGIALTDAAIKGLGIVQLPNEYVENALQKKQLIPILNEFQKSDEGIWAVYPQNKYLLPRVRLLVDYLAENL